MSLKWIVSQIGARQHFGVPRGFLYKDELRLLYTDAWCRVGRSLLQKAPDPLRSFAGRYHPDIPSSKVVSFNLQSVYHRIKYVSQQQDIVSQSLNHIRVGKWFAEQVAQDLSRRPLDADEDAFFGFNTGCLEVIQMLAQRRIITVVDQMDPARVEEQLVYEEMERWPGWQKVPGRVPDVFWHRMDAEWAAASMVLVNSRWSRKALIQQGVPEEKIVIIPPPYEPVKLRLPARRNMENPLTILWLGAVNLRKGIQYLMQAARLLEHNSRVRFLIVGPILISDDAVKSAPANMQFLGKVTRAETGELYQKADVFVLPTLSDGFAVVQLEAMSHGLPVIITSNCGEVVTDGHDGFVVPAYDGPALAQAIARLDQDRQLLRDMSYRAIRTSTNYYLPRQALILEEAVDNFRKGVPLEQRHLRITPAESLSFHQSPMLPPMEKQKPRVAMIQDGARRRYMVPLALQQTGMLECVYTDWLVREASIESKIAAMVGKFKPNVGRRMSERSCEQLDAKKVISNWSLALRLQARMRRFAVAEDSFIYGSHRTAEWILREGFGSANAVYGFIRNAAPEIFRQAKKQGLRTCADQIIAPYQVELDELVQQQRRWPGWSKSETASLHEGFLKFEQQTWEQLDCITCMSDYVRQGLISVGVPDTRIRVIPYPWAEAKISNIKREPHSRPLTVGFVGAVGLRKGAPYFLEVARRFASRPIKFVMVGKVLLNPDNLGAFGNVQFTGSVPRSQVNDWLKQFDVFFFPSTCEGSAGAVMEAMASGLPVLTTPNSGSRVRHEVDGFVYRYDELDRFEQAIDQLDSDRELLHRMGESGRTRILSYDMNAYSADLAKLFDELVAGPAL